MIKSKEEIDKLNIQQHQGRFHPYTCCGFDGCVRSEQDDEGILIATEQFWVCPCGKYTQEYRDDM